MTSLPRGIFRKEAVDHHIGDRIEGEPLLMLPGWTKWTYRILVLLLGAGLAFIGFGSISQYVEGPAVIRADRKVLVTATESGVIDRVLVATGRRVNRGDVLASFRSADEEAQLASVQREFDSAIIRILTNPADALARQSIGSVRAQRELVAARLRGRVTLASEAGIVGDIRVRPGLSVAPGDLILSLLSEQASFAVVALFPGQHRPSLRPGLRLRLEITAFPQAYQDLTVASVDDEVVGPYEVRRMLGPETADSLVVAGPLVVVRAHLPNVTFVSAGATYRYFDGMHAIARTRLRSERILRTLVPGIKVPRETPQ